VNSFESILEEARQQFYFSGYQLAGKWGNQSFSSANGISTYWPMSYPVTAASRFDIGSVTKAVATTTILARAVDRKEISLEDTVGKWLPEFEGTAYAGLVLSDLLSHSAGLLWWYPIYKEPKGISLIELFKREEKTFCEAPPGTRTVYSDLGFLLLGLVLEKYHGPLRSQLHAEVIEPLDLKATQYGPVQPKLAVATEYSEEKKLPILGEVFDENAAFLGGECAHAGIFSTAEDLVAWATGWLFAVQGKSGWISKKTAERFTQPANRVPGSPWAMGWDTKSPTGSSAGTLLSEKSFGHLGFPGCSVWVDPVASAVVVLLTNRIHPSRLDERIKVLRPKLHDAIALQYSRTERPRR